MEKKLRRRCYHCNEIREVGVEIFWKSCPWDFEINDDDKKVWHCNDCDYACTDEI